MNYRYLTIILVLSISLACKRINPDKPSFQGEQMPLPQPTSTINIPLEIPLDYLEQHLNNGLKELIYSENGLDVGNGISTDIEVFRTGQLKMSSHGENILRVRLPMRLKGNLKIEKKIFGQRLSTSIPYDEGLSPVVLFSPKIGKDWDVAINNLTIESWGRSLKYNLLGYEVDFDPIIKSRVENVLRNQLGSQGLSRISFKKMATEAWEAFGQPFSIGQGEVETYIQTVPQKIKINEKLTSDNKLKLNIGLEGVVTTYFGQRPPVQASPLPGLYYNDDTTNRLDITLPLAISYSTLDDFLRKELSGKTFKVDNQTNFIPKALSTQSFGDRALVQMDFTLERSGRKDVTGEIFLVGKPTFEQERQAIVFEDIDFDINSKNILANNASWLKQAQLLDLISKHAFFPIGPHIDQARLLLQQRGYLTTDFVDLRVLRPELDVAGIYVTDTDVRLYLHTSGEMEVRLTNPKDLID